MSGWHMTFLCIKHYSLCSNFLDFTAPNLIGWIFVYIDFNTACLACVFSLDSKGTIQSLKCLCEFQSIVYYN